MRERYLVGIYETYLNYGGPEEGGWWYDAGTLVRPISVEKNIGAAMDKASKVNRWLRFFFNKSGRRNRFSMGYTGGDCIARVFENELPTHFPEERPHYE